MTSTAEKVDVTNGTSISRNISRRQHMGDCTPPPGATAAASRRRMRGANANHVNHGSGTDAARRAPQGRRQERVTNLEVPFVPDTNAIRLSGNFFRR